MKKKHNFLTDILIQKSVMTVLEFYFAEFLKKMFRHLRLEPANQSLQQIVPQNQSGLRKREGLLQLKYCRTTIKRKSIGNSLRKAYI